MPSSSTKSSTAILNWQTDTLPSRNQQPHSLGQPFLSLIESPKLTCAQFQGTCHMECVQCSATQTRNVLSRQLDRQIKGRFGHGRLKPQSELAVVPKPVISPAGLHR